MKYSLEIRKNQCLKIMSKFKIDNNIICKVNEAKCILDIDKAINKILPVSIRNKVEIQFNKNFKGGLGPLEVKKQ